VVAAVQKIPQEMLVVELAAVEQGLLMQLVLAVLEQ
jgi:hypothetical protein